MEKNTLSDLVDFKGIMLQKFETIAVSGTHLIIRYKDKETKCKINSNIDLVKGIVSNLNKLGLFNEEGIGSISILKSLAAFDKDYQSKLKN